PTVGSTDQAVNTKTTTIAMPSRIRMGVSYWVFGQSLRLSNCLHPSCSHLISLCDASQKDAFVWYRRTRRVLFDCASKKGPGVNPVRARGGRSRRRSCSRARPLHVTRQPFLFVIETWRS